MTDKLIIRKGDKTTGYAPIFVGVEYHQKVKDLAPDSKLSMRTIIEQMIRFSLDHIEIVEDENATN